MTITVVRQRELLRLDRRGRPHRPVDSLVRTRHVDGDRCDREPDVGLRGRYPDTVPDEGHDAQTLTVAEQEAAKWQAAQDAHEQERRRRLDQTGKRALPMLRDIILAGGELSDAQRIESRVLEAGLRDEIRGRRLLNDRVRNSVLAARRRGTAVAGMLTREPSTTCRTTSWRSFSTPWPTRWTGPRPTE